MALLLPNNRGVPFGGHCCDLPLGSCVLAEYQGLDPPGEVLLVTHTHAEGHNLFRSDGVVTVGSLTSSAYSVQSR